MKHIPRTLLLTMPTALLLMSTTASYAAIDAQGAAELKSLISNYIQEQQKITAATGATLVANGETTVTPQGTYYSVILPHLVTRYPGDVVSYDMGKIAINAMPGKTADEWKVSFSLPRTVSVNTPKDGKVDFHFGQQKASGLWNSKMNYMFQINAEYKNVTIEKTMPDTPEPQVPLVTIGTINIKQNLQEDTPGSKTWSGPADFSAQNIQTDKLSIGEVSANYMIKNVDYTVMTKMRDELKSMGENSQSLSDLQNNPTAALNMFDVMAKMFENPMGEFTSELTLKDLKATGYTNTPEASGDEVTLKSAHFGMDMNLSNPQKASMVFRLGLDGLDVPLEDKKDVTPKNAELEIKVDSLPLMELVKTTRQIAGVEMQGATPDATPVKPYPQILAEAQTSFSNKVDINTDILNVHGQGAAQASGQSMIGLTTDQNWEIKGLDALLEKLKNDQQNPEISQQIAQKLAILQLMGQMSPDKPDIRTYHLVVDDQGKMTMNGADLMSMMGNMK
ncbi:MAG: hypothetical protein AUJ12_02000 [Alphaproteobacteria bacterium CG1_02_46_17]|nr:MAG: hypothetical protein AUJ12_02000 [Alphaproteobacteria bacterium CG1_02_46_17]